MNLLQAMLTGTFACLTLAIMSGFVYMIAKARCDRQAVPTVASARRPDSYMEVWECPHCHRIIYYSPPEAEPKSGAAESPG